MRARTVCSVALVGIVLLASACASHAPTVQCEKHLAPINVGGAPLHKDVASAARKS